MTNTQSTDASDLKTALEEIKNNFANKSNNNWSNDDFYISSEAIIERNSNKQFAASLHFYAGVQCFSAGNLFHALVHVIECLKADKFGTFQGLCRPYVDFIDEHGPDNSGFKYNLSFLYSKPLLRQRNYRYARALKFRSFKDGEAKSLASLGYDFFYGRGIRQNDHIAYALFRSSVSDTTDGLQGLLLCKALGIATIDDSGLLADYHKLATSNRDWSTEFIIRACLGLRGERDPITASALAFESEQRSGDRASTLLYQVISDPDFQLFIAQNETAARMINDYGWNLTPGHYPPPDRAQHARHMGVLTGALAQLAVSEASTFEYEWAVIASQFGCHYWNLSYTQVMKNSLAIGNPLQATTKLGIPKATWPRTTDRSNLQPPQCDGFKLRMRDKEIRYIKGQFVEHKKLYHSNIFSDEDLMVAMALAFTGDKPEHPWFSIESMGKGFVEERIIPIKTRAYGPAWLGGTAIGDALYLADQMMPTFGMGCLFSWCDFFHNARFEHEQHAADFYRAIENAEGASPFPVGRNSIDSQSVNPPSVTPRTPWWYFGRRQIETYQMAAMQMRFDASYIYYDENGEEKRNGFPNDPSTRLGHRAMVGSQRYEELARAFPVFARVRLFLMVSATLAALAKEQGYTVSPALRRKLQGLRTRYARRAPRSGDPFPIFRSYSNIPRLARDDP